MSTGASYATVVVDPRPDGRAQRAAIARLAVDHGDHGRVHARLSADNRPLWVTWLDAEPARVMPDGTVHRGAVQRNGRGVEDHDGLWSCPTCWELRRPVPATQPPRNQEVWEAERAARASACPVCGGLGVLIGPAVSKRAALHRSTIALSDWLARHPGEVAVSVRPARWPLEREQTRAVYARFQAERPDLSGRALRELVAQQLGVSQRKVKRDLARGRHAAHGDQPLPPIGE